MWTPFIDWRRETLPLPFFFERKTASENLIALSHKTMAPFNAQATLWFRDAFAALYLPTTVHGRVSDIWRSYAAQAAFRCQGLSLAFSPPVVEQDRNAHDFMGDYTRVKGPSTRRAGRSSSTSSRGRAHRVVRCRPPSSDSFVDATSAALLKFRTSAGSRRFLRMRSARRTTARRSPGGPTGTSAAAGGAAAGSDVRCSPMAVARGRPAATAGKNPSSHVGAGYPVAMQ